MISREGVTFDFREGGEYFIAWDSCLSKVQVTKKGFLVAIFSIFVYFSLLLFQFLLLVFRSFVCSFVVACLFVCLFACLIWSFILFV